jgi:aminoglycoside phosphotransferase (APT) family kinase protein
VRAALLASYGVDATELRRHPFGFESECWIADDRWFLKVWRHGPPANLALLEQLDLPVPRPLRNEDGELVTRSGGRAFAVFPYVDGRPATWDDWAEIARAMRMLHELPVDGLGIPEANLDEPAIRFLRDNLDHPWIRDRAAEVVQMVDRLEAVIDRAGSVDATVNVLCHNDLIGDNLLIGDDGRLAAILDWDHATLGPREHDVWIATEGPRAHEFLSAYGAADLDRTHLEWALLRRAVGDLAARVREEVDRPGIETWGFDRWRRLDANLALLTGDSGR